jgi:hypothetical protein
VIQQLGGAVFCQLGAEIILPGANALAYCDRDKENSLVRVGHCYEKFFIRHKENMGK